MIGMEMVLTRLYKQCWLGSLCHTSLRRPFSFLHFLPLINALFLPMNHIFSQLNPSPPFSRSCFVFVLALLWKQWVGGHLFPPVLPMPGTHTGTGRQHVCEPAGASWGWGGPSVEGPADSCWTLPPSVPPPPPLPAPWWVVASTGLIVRLRRQTLEAWGDFPTFISLLYRKKPLSTSTIWGQWCPVRSLLTYLLTKSLSLKENFCFSGSEYFTRSVCHLIQEVSITGNPFIESIETAKKKKKKSRMTTLFLQWMLLCKYHFRSVLFRVAHKNKQEPNPQPLCMQWKRNSWRGTPKAETLQENTVSHCKLRAAMLVYTSLSLTPIQIVALFLLTLLEMCKSQWHVYYWDH